MNNFMISLKKFFKNKNTITILGVILIIIILFVGYRMQIKRQVNPVSVPVASETIQPRTKITKDLIKYVDVAPIVLGDNVITSSAKIIGKYSNYNTVIPAGSMFYEETVIDEANLPDASLINLEKGQVPYNFPVSVATTYGNSIFPGNYIDIYMKAQNNDGVLMVGKLLENVKVLAVKDSSGRNVFENTSEDRTPSYLIFGLSASNNILLRKASYMNAFSVELFPVPHGVNVEAQEGETVVSSKTLEDFINANTAANPEITEEKDNTTNTSKEG